MKSDARRLNCAAVKSGAYVWLPGANEATWVSQLSRFVQPALTLTLTLILSATFKAQVSRIAFVSSFKTAGCRYHLF